MPKTGRQTDTKAERATHKKIANILIAAESFTTFNNHFDSCLEPVNFNGSTFQTSDSVLTSQCITEIRRGRERERETATVRDGIKLSRWSTLLKFIHLPSDTVHAVLSVSYWVYKKKQHASV